MKRRFIGSLVLTVAIVAFPAEGATADCLGPRISFAPEAVDPGDTLTITGKGFWDKCIDTFPTQEVATPIENIELIMVQGSSSWVIARGSADENAEFTVEVVVPPAAQPGEARLTATAGQSQRFPLTRTLAISTKPAPDTISGAVTAFGPDQDATTTTAAAPSTTNSASTLEERPTATSEGEDEGSDALIIFLVIAGGVAAVALATWMIRQRRAGPR
jgi:hypothetical protein